jgi:hypothetical protein
MRKICSAIFIRAYSPIMRKTFTDIHENILTNIDEDILAGVQHPSLLGPQHEIPHRLPAGAHHRDAAAGIIFSIYRNAVIYVYTHSIIRIIMYCMHIVYVYT